jgi:ABC-type bacteriocin/lantibiotic exporter with double-glycine peptidase domain
MVKNSKKTEITIYKFLVAHLSAAERIKLLVFLIAKLTLAALDVLTAILISYLGIFLLNTSEFANPSSSQFLAPFFSLKDFLQLSNEVFNGYVGLLTFIIIVLKVCCNLLLEKQIFLFIASISTRFSQNAFKSLSSVNYLWLKNKHEQEILYAMTQGPQYLVVGILGQSLLFLCDAIALLVFLTLMFYTNVLLTTLLLLSVFTIALFYTKAISAKIHAASDLRVNQDIEGQEITSDLIHFWRELKFVESRNFMVDDYTRTREGASRAFALINWYQLFPKAALEIGAILFLGIAALPSLPIFPEEFSNFSSIVMTLALSSRVLPLLTRVQQSFFTIKTYLGPSSQFMRFQVEMDLNLDVVINVPSTKVHNYQIELTNMKFAYKDGTQQSVYVENSVIPLGSTVGVVGASGNGKSTFCDLLLGFLEPDSGSIKIGGLPPKAFRFHNPEAISYLVQSNKMGHGTILEYLVFGRFVDDEVLKQITKLIENVGLSSLIEQLPAGLNTSLNGATAMLSGGEQQRLGIIRILLGNPRIVVIDEGTNALDGENRVNITSLISKLKGKSTVIMITHDSESLSICDFVIEFNDGCGTFIKSPLMND